MLKEYNHHIPNERINVTGRKEKVIDILHSQSFFARITFASHHKITFQSLVQHQ